VTTTLNQLRDLVQTTKNGSQWPVNHFTQQIVRVKKINRKKIKKISGDNQSEPVNCTGSNNQQTIMKTDWG
jgi:hypothetical protein